MKKLIALARQAMQNAYAPYSKFQVGAAIEADNARLYAGCNVENISYGLTQCAEASAIGAMISDGSQKIKAIVIVSNQPDYLSPCGACRQRIAEFADDKTKIHLINRENQCQTYSLDDLLPLTFNQNMLGGAQ